MAPFKELKSDDIEILHKWLKSMDMPVNRQFSRDYSDGVLVARLLKCIYPRHIDLHSYQSRFSHDLKVVNWQMLHFKVFSKIGLPLSKELMSTLAKGETAAIERLLYAIMTIAKRNSTKISHTSMKSETMFKEDQKKLSITPPAPTTTESMPNVQKRITQMATIIKPNVKVNKPNQIVDAGEEAMIPFGMYEGTLYEIRSKDNTIKELSTKLEELENLLKEKDSEINTLKKESRGLLVI